MWAADGVGQLHELHQVVERLPVGEAAGRALQAELGQDGQHLLDHALHVAGALRATTVSSTPTVRPCTGSSRRAT